MGGRLMFGTFETCNEILTLRICQMLVVEFGSIVDRGRRPRDTLAARVRLGHRRSIHTHTAGHRGDSAGLSAHQRRKPPHRQVTEAYDRFCWRHQRGGKGRFRGEGSHGGRVCLLGSRRSQVPDNTFWFSLKSYRIRVRSLGVLLKSLKLTAPSVVAIH
jgi:hypothetical protein